MSSVTTAPVTGTDGHVPIWVPDGRWQYYALSDLWMGREGKGKFVANVKDYAKDPDTNTTYIVDHVDPVTLIPTLRVIRPSGVTFTFEEDDILLGVGPTAPTESLRAYLDRSTMPYTMNIDRRCYVPGSTASYARVFRGPVAIENMTPISKVFNANGEFVSDRVGLEVALIDSHQVNQHTLKIVDTFRVTEGMVDGEVVTLVVYTQDGHVCYKRQLLVENTAFISGAADGRRYVSHISVDSSYLEQGQSDLLSFPLNLPLTSMDLMVNVHYSDGSKMQLPVSDARVEVHGLEQYVSAIPGQQIELVVFYRLADGEAALQTADYVLGKVRKRLTLTTSATNYSHAVQLMAYPIWQSEALGYRMQFWMFNLDRKFFQDVTPHVEWSTRTGAFDPKGYGILQTREVSVDLRAVSGSFKSRRHVQVMDIVLMNRPDQGTLPWTVAHISDQSYPAYQGSLRAVRAATGDLFRIDNGMTKLNDWLAQVYYVTRPLTDPTAELGAPKPTHMVIRQGNDVTTVPIGAFISDQTLGRRLADGQTVTITFIKRISSGDLYLAQAAMLVK